MTPMFPPVEISMTERLTQLTKLFELDPTDAFGAYAIALEHAKAGHTDDAVAWLDKTLSLDGHYHYAYYQKGKLLHESGAKQDAITALETGLAIARADRNEKASSELAELLDMVQAS